MNPATGRQLPQNVQLEIARRELAGMEAAKQLLVDSIDKLETVKAVLDGKPPTTRMSPETDNSMLRLFTALGGIVDVQLMQLRSNVAPLPQRISELKDAINRVETGILIPSNMKV